MQGISAVDANGHASRLPTRPARPTRPVRRPAEAARPHVVGVLPLAELLRNDLCLAGVSLSLRRELFERPPLEFIDSMLFDGDPQGRSRPEIAVEAISVLAVNADVDSPAD